MSAFAFMSLAAITVNLVVGVYVLSRGPRILLNRLLFAVLMALVVWGAGEFIMRSATTTSVATTGARIAGLGWCFVGALFVTFVLAFVEKEKLLRRPITYILLFVPGAVFAVLLWTTDLIFKGFDKSYWGYREIEGTARIPSQLYVALLFIVGLVLLFNFWRATPSRRKRTNTGFVLVASLIPICTGMVTDIILPVAGIRVVELAMFSSAAIGPLLSYAVINHGLLTTITGSMGSAIINKIQEAVLVTDSEGLIENANPAAERLLGYSESELLETPVDRLFRKVSEDADGGLMRAWSLCLGKQGEEIPVTVSTEAVSRRTGRAIGSVIVLHDMRETMKLIEAEREAELATARVEAERDRSETLQRSQEELRELSKFLESVIDNIAEPMAIKDREFRFVFVNRELCEISGYPREYLIGKKVDDFVPEEYARKSNEIDREILVSGNTVEYEVVGLKDAYGNLLHVKHMKFPLTNDSGEVEYIVGMLTDITEQRRLDESRLDFIRIAAHELRTPLTSLKLGFDVLARETRGALNEEQQRSLDILSLSIERLDNLARNLLDLASIDAGLVTLDRQALPLGPLVEEAVAVFSSTINEKGLFCRVELDDELRPAYADASRLSQVLYNLVSNAVKYTEAGGITISARDPGDGFLEVCVADTGVGISAHHVESIFTSFGKPQNMETTREGTGLGLSITKAIVEAHGGSIRVESRLGAGSRFYFTVRAAAAESEVDGVNPT